ncbi:MAG: hypothetical protein ACD_62C00495G0012, partial [uncultured bacterium]
MSLNVVLSNPNTDLGACCLFH